MLRIERVKLGLNPKEKYGCYTFQNALAFIKLTDVYLETVYLGYVYTHTCAGYVSHLQLCRLCFYFCVN